MNEDKELHNFRDFVSKISEKYSDYLIMTRDQNGGIFWRVSDPTWALGAAHRLITATNEEDKCGEINGLMDNENDDE